MSKSSTARVLPFPIVGIGASAGGVEALKALFSGMPEKPGVALVIVTHLNPDRESLLDQVVAHLTPLPVLVAADRMEVEPDHVYVMPPDAILGMHDGHLTLTRLAEIRERKPVDIFLSALALDQNEYAVSIILSGGDGDGTLGTKAIKERGGLTFAQAHEGTTPAHPSMPEAAISAGYVDLALPASEMGAKLAAYARRLAHPVIVQGETLPASVRPLDTEIPRLQIDEICALLRAQVGHDFSGYKTQTFQRRIRRRMHVRGADLPIDYVEILRNDARELQLLFRDLLINVTDFFRDAEAFEKLKELVIPKLFAGRGANDIVRVWVPGCATGEEVYSIAILMLEHLDGVEVKPRVQIFATDIQEQSLEAARIGRYPNVLLEGVSPERRLRFFEAEEGSHVVRKSIRDLCVFSPHSLIRDPPFSRLDLISCRNLLIYFGAEVQRQVIPTFHYALRPGGFLFLGSSEHIGPFANLFMPLDKGERIFRRLDVELSARPYLLTGNPRQDPVFVSGSFRRPPLTNLGVRHALETQLLENFAPPHVVVTRTGEVIHYSMRTGKYLEPAAGAPSTQLLSLARRGIRLDLRNVLNQAVESGQTASRSGVRVSSEDGVGSSLTLTVQPLEYADGAEPLFLVLFIDEVRSSAESLQPPEPTTPETVQLERELRDTRERLQSLIEEYEAALEELKSSNEELLSVNEEMHATNEELEASKEELQSVNEELHTVNSELSNKVEALDRAKEDLETLLASTELPMIVVGEDLKIRTYTPAAAQVFSVLPSDRGRPLTDLQSRLMLPDLKRDVQKVAETGISAELPVVLEDNSAFRVRLAPYRNREDKIDGVVLTVVDVSNLVESEKRQRMLIAELNHRVKNMLTVAISIAELTYRSAPDVATFKSTFVSRLHAMARSYELLARQNWRAASIADLVKLELEPFGLERVQMEGPDLQLEPRLALSLGMVLHELATNAGKYGSLTVEGGKVLVSWLQPAESAPGSVDLTWREQGAPTTEPQHRGFGLNLVEREAKFSLGGSARIEFGPHGVQVTLKIRR